MSAHDPKRDAGPPPQFSGTKLLSSKSAVCELGLEGIVSKKLSAPYHGSFGPGEKAPFFLFRILPPGETVAAAQK